MVHFLWGRFTLMMNGRTGVDTVHTNSMLLLRLMELMGRIHDNMI